MASFNQVPLGQTSLTVSAFSLDLGSAAHLSDILFFSTPIVTDGAGVGSSVAFIPEPPAPPPGMYPSWRRSPRNISVQ